MRPGTGQAAGPAGRARLPLGGITGGGDWRTAPLLKTRTAAGFCLRAPPQGACAYVNDCEHCSSNRPDPASLQVLAAHRLDADALARDAEARGWIDEAARHHRLIARLDALIAETEAAAG